MTDKDWKDMTGAERGTHMRKVVNETADHAAKVTKELEAAQAKKRAEEDKKLHERWHPPVAPEVKPHADADTKHDAVSGRPEHERPQGQSAEGESHLGGSKDAEHRATGPVSKVAHVSPKPQGRKP